MTREERFMQEAIRLSEKALAEKKGGPFGCIVVKGDHIVGSGMNSVLATQDPTAHAEVVAIRNACKKLGSFQLEDCEIYTSCEPCPMCLGAIYWARPKVVYYANTKDDAAKIGFDDAFIYKEIGTPQDRRKISFKRIILSDAAEAFSKWKNENDKKVY